MALIGGVLLAGGKSRRFGSEKAMALWTGRPLIAWAADRLAPGCDAIAVSAGPGSGAAAWARSTGLAVLSDPPGLPPHPLAGVLAGLNWAMQRGYDRIETAPCDTPTLPADLQSRLCEALTPKARAAYATSPGGAHPLCAVWRVSAADTIAAALARGEPPVLRVLEALAAAPVAFPADSAFANVNTNEDLDAL